MARIDKEKSSRENQRNGREQIRGKRTNGELSELSTLDAVQELAVYDARHSNTEEGLVLFLKSWWSKEYSRPLKDPLLETYTIHELLYEYYDKIERATAADEAFELKADKIEAADEQDTMDWVEEEERRDREAAELVEAKAQKDDEWMVKQLKKEHGDDFGDDIATDFAE